MAAVVAGFAADGARSGPVAGECVSACVYALMGAVRRIAPPASRVALHRMSIESDQGGPKILADPHLVSVVARYAQRMGVSAKVVWAAESMAPDHVRILSAHELSAWGLATSRY
jgi:hypothetical protein